MNRLRAIYANTVRASPVLTRIVTPSKIQRAGHHAEGPPQPFDNMPFSIPNRFVATACFSVFFGIGLWAPFIILWYNMAKRAL